MSLSVGSLSASECSLFSEWHRKLAKDCDEAACDSISNELYNDADCDADCDGCCDAMSCNSRGCNSRGCGSKNCCLKWGDGSSCLDFLPRTNLCLPLMREQAESRGVTLPLPVGFSVISTVMRRHVAVSDVRIGLGNNPPTSLKRVSVDEFDVVASNQVARADLWILPCMNVYAIAGHTRSTGDLVVNVEQFPFPGSPSFAIPINIRLNGFTYGGGGTVAVGTPKHFATLDVNYSHTDFDKLANELFALVITPRFGAVINHPCYKGEVHIGAMYQDTRQTVEVVQEQSPIGPIKVSVDQFEPRPWNFLVGTLWALDERLHAVVEFGFGGREYVISGLTARF
ncbi:MAG: hypothetical protein ACR2NZ_23185 [Rubripirellula sp.]